MNAFLCIVLSNFFVRLFSLLLLTFSLLTSRMYLLCSQRWPCLTRFRSDDDGNGLHFTDILCLLRCHAESVTLELNLTLFFTPFFFLKRDEGSGGWKRNSSGEEEGEEQSWPNPLKSKIYMHVLGKEKEKKRKERVDQLKLWLLWMHSFLPLLSPVAVVLIIDDDDLSLSNSFFFPLNCFLYFFFLTSPSRRMMLLAWEGFRECLLLLLMDNLRFQISTFAYIFQFYSRMNRYVSFTWK